MSKPLRDKDGNIIKCGYLGCTENATELIIMDDIPVPRCDEHKDKGYWLILGKLDENGKFFTETKYAPFPS